ncbi:MAG: ABC transporter permease [Gammaproteobacteria bacterium]
MISLRRFLAALRARLPEFYRDRASLLWNIAMPILLILGFAFVFTGEDEDLFTVAVLGDAADSPFAATPHVRFVPLNALAPGLEKLRRHQYDLLIDVRAAPRYWLNDSAPKGALAERLLLGSYAQAAPIMPTRQTVAGAAIRYVDWLLPGVLAMNLMFSCLWGVGWVVVRYRKNGVLRRLQATPLTAFEFLAAQVAARLVIVLAVTTVVYVAALWLIGFRMQGSHGLLFLTFLVGSACLTSVGLLVAARLRTEELADGLLNLLSWPQLILSGVWFSLEGVNPAARALAQAFPLTHLVDAARRIMLDGAGLAEVGPQLAILAGLTLALLAAAARMFRWN